MNKEDREQLAQEIVAEIHRSNPKGLSFEQAYEKIGEDARKAVDIFLLEANYQNISVEDAKRLVLEGLQEVIAEES